MSKLLTRKCTQKAYVKNSVSVMLTKKVETQTRKQGIPTNVAVRKAVSIVKGDIQGN